MRSAALLVLLVCASTAACVATPNESSEDPDPGEDGEAALTAGPYKNGLAQKVYPTNKDRDLTCPTAWTSAGPKYARANADLGSVDVERGLEGVVPTNFRVAVILVKRVDGVPHYRYLSNGTEDVVYQPWSSTKWMATANAGAHLREASGGAVGLTSSVNGIPMGDLLTGIETYMPKMSSSNGLSRYMHDVGGRARAKSRVTQWLGRMNENFGGNYGELPPDLPFTFKEPSGASVSVTKDTQTGFENQLSALTQAEFLKRLVMHREDAATRMPHLQWADMRVLFYGAEDSKWYPGKWGGMSADKAIFVQSALDMRAVEADARGKWRIFSKVGYGQPTDPRRGNGEFVEVTYGCFPKVDAQGKAVPNAGHELIIAAMQGAGGANSDEREKLFAQNHEKVLKKVLDGSFD